MLAADEALRSATDAGKKTTDAASNAFDEAQKKLLNYEKIAHPSIADISGRMARAKEKDQRSLGLFNKLRAKRGIYTPNDPPTLRINFVLPKFLTDPNPLIVHQVLSSKPMSSEILWNFSRYTDDRRIALRQNPHFYLHLPTFGDDAYGTRFPKVAMKDFLLKPNDTVYVLVDKPDLGRVFLEVDSEAKIRKRTFGNVWMPNNVLIFKDIRGTLEDEQLVGKHIRNHQTLFWRDEPKLPDIYPKDSSAISWKFPTLPVPWNTVTDIQDWKVLVRERTLQSTRTSVKICVSHASHPVVTNNQVPRAPEQRAADASNQSSDVPPATNLTRASSSVHVGVPPTHSANTQCLPQTQVHPAPLVPEPPNQRTSSSKPTAATIPSPPAHTSPAPSPPPSHPRGSPVSATPHISTQSSSPLPKKPPATQGLRKNVPSPQLPAKPGLFSETNPPSMPINVTPITNPGPRNQTAQHSHPQPTSNNVQPRSQEQKSIQNRAKVDNPASPASPAQDGKRPTKPTKSSISISSFTHMFKPQPMPGPFPGPQMEVDWVMVSQGPTDVQGGNWLKRLFRRHG
ncbi:hypothetical protein EDB92DRAFT_374246 [Lactarius akahatsu]|uniref:Uncharacterized protein n=1 Tax=Lactarius akahatsu TaxID=416441 RepID=A0AAD4QEU6_9AGAM|nr:hypothetical protein EDB92DRAFT_374246 [Lactarius akahatsu]